MTESLLNRLRMVVIAMGLVAGLAISQLVRIQFGGQVAYFGELGATVQKQEVRILSTRGRIFDAGGELLATNDTVYEVGLDTKTIADVGNIEELAVAVASYVGLTPEEIVERYRSAVSEQRPLAYVVLNRSLPQEAGRALQRAYDDPDTPDMRGVLFTPLYARKYPSGGVAAQLLGFVAEEQSKGRPAGYYGVEAFYDDLLAGTFTTGLRPIVPFDVELDTPPRNGVDLVLTIDREVQADVERAMADAMVASGAPSGTILAMNPQTGEILGMTSWPTYDPNKYLDFPEAAHANPAVSAQYEPGSVFKVLTMAAALDAGIVTPNTPFLDTGAIEVGGARIHNWDGGAWGPQDMLGCMQHSLNVCLAAVATWMGPGIFYNYMAAFGIGHITNVDMASEAPGTLKRPGDENWYDSDLGTNAFGQGVAVTPVQLLTAISAVANRGAMMQPHVLHAVVDSGQIHTFQPTVLGRPIRPETAATLSDMLATSLEKEASSALVPGYRAAGKTGTAEVPVPGGYDSSATIASFVGWLPVDDPQLLILVKIDRPTSAPWGSVVAAPVFSKLAQRLVVLLQIPPDAVRLGLAGR